MLFRSAKDARSQQRLKDQFERREPDRKYLALVYGHPDPAQGTWRHRLAWDSRALEQRQAPARDPRGVEAISSYRVVERFRETSLLEVTLQTGKRNQIRIQAALLGHPLVGEQQYVYGDPSSAAIDFPRQALHAWRLAFRHPVDGRTVRVEAPVPRDLTSLLEGLRCGVHT